jgi:outer membrane protein assembly factor BamA
VAFRGFGNDVPDLRGDFYSVRQRQWVLRPAVALALGPSTDVSLGPVLRYAVTDSVPDRFISESLPYGAGHFGQAGVQLAFRRDTRDNRYNPRRGIVTDVMATAYPAIWEARSPFQEIAAVTSTYFELPGSTHPVLALRAGGKKLFGDFPYYEAAFIGGRNTMRTLHNQRYAGDASLYGSTELRVPVTRFSFFLPFNVGLLGFADAGRVFVKGDSPGGWHQVTGAGFWLGALNPVTSVSVMLTSQRDRRVLLATGVSF